MNLSTVDFLKPSFAHFLAGHAANMSLLNEMELSDSEKSLNASRRPFSQIEEEDDEVECEHPPDTNLGALETKEVS